MKVGQKVNVVNHSFVEGVGVITEAHDTYNDGIEYHVKMEGENMPRVFNERFLEIVDDYLE